jgi:hypothetical protein
MRWALVLGLLAVGCGGVPAESDPVDVPALDRLWAEVYGMSGPAPRVGWVPPEHFNCTDGERPWGWLDGSGRCVQGQALSAGLVLVGVVPEKPVSDWFLAHEFSHARSFAMGADGDPGHEGDGFGRGSYQQRAQDWLDAEFGTRRERPDQAP